MPELIIRLSWKTSGPPVTHLVSLVHVSDETVTVLMDVEPPQGLSFALILENANVRRGPIPSSLIDKETMDSGRTLARFRFESSLPLEELAHFKGERCAWKRVVPREKRAVLTWRTGLGTTSFGVKCAISVVAGQPCELKFCPLRINLSGCR